MTATFNPLIAKPIKGLSSPDPTSPPLLTILNKALPMDLTTSLTYFSIYFKLIKIFNKKNFFSLEIVDSKKVQ